MLWPAEKNLAELIALSAALLVASQFWYLDKGGALVMLYLPAGDRDDVPADPGRAPARGAGACAAGVKSPTLFPSS